MQCFRIIQTFSISGFVSVCTILAFLSSYGSCRCSSPFLFSIKQCTTVATHTFSQTKDILEQSKQLPSFLLRSQLMNACDVCLEASFLDSVIVLALFFQQNTDQQEYLSARSPAHLLLPRRLHIHFISTVKETHPPMLFTSQSCFLSNLHLYQKQHLCLFNCLFSCLAPHSFRQKISISVFDIQEAETRHLPLSVFLNCKCLIFVS